MTTQTETATLLLMSLEASAKQRYEEAFGRGDFEQVISAAHVDLESGERIVVTYDACGRTAYLYREAQFEALQPVLNRTVCLLMLTQRLGEAVAS